VWLFTRPAIWHTWDISHAGDVGETIGGITAPVIELIGSVLIYLSFRQQIEANKIQFDSYNEQKEQSNQANNYERLMGLYNELKYDLEKLRYIKHNGDIKEYLGPDALEHFVIDLKKTGDKVFEENTIFMNEFLYLSSSLYYLIFKIEELHTQLNPTDKSILFQKIEFMYHARFDDNLTVLVNYAYHSKEQKFKNWGVALNDINGGIRKLFKVLGIYLK